MKAAHGANQNINDGTGNKVETRKDVAEIHDGKHAEGKPRFQQKGKFAQ